MRPLDITAVTSSVISAILMVISVVGNIVVIICYSRKPLRNPSNLFLINLAVCDLTVTMVTPAIIMSTLAGEMTFNQTTCTFLGFNYTRFGVFRIDL